MTSVLETLSALDRQVRAMAEAESVSDVFRVLLESSRVVAPRTAVYLVRQGNVIACTFHPELTEDTRVHRLLV